MSKDNNYNQNNNDRGINPGDPYKRPEIIDNQEQNFRNQNDYDKSIISGNDDIPNQEIDLNIRNDQNR